MIYLDEDESRARKAERAWRFNVVEVPGLRLIGYTSIIGLIWLWNVASSTPLMEEANLRNLTIVCVLYCGISWGLLYVCAGRIKHFDLGLFFLITDNVIYTAIIYMTGAEKSLLYVLLMIRVADQANTNFTRVLLFAHYSFLCYVMMVWYTSTVREVDFTAAVTRGCTLYVVNFYISLTARTAEALRRQTTAAIHVARELLARSERMTQQNATLLRFTHSGIYSLDARGVTLQVNPAGAAMLGYSVDELIGTPMHERIHYAHADRTPNPISECFIHRVIETGVPIQSMEDVFWRRDGRALPVELACAPIEEEGRVVGAVITFVDITQRHEVARMKGEFVSIVSHELRTPLTSIRGSLGMLAHGLFGELQPRGRRMLEIAVANTDRLVRLINDILDLERMQSGNLRLEYRRVSVEKLMIDATEGVRGIGDRYGVKLEWQGLPVWVEADPDRIVQVLINLLGNAIKFSNSGGRVRLSAEVTQNQVRFDVMDEGRGIPSEMQELIFDRFQQVDASDARQKGGTGLGLTICRNIVERHGGRIWVDSAVERGSTFHFTVPLSSSVPLEAIPSSPPFPTTASAANDTPAGQRPLRVLIAEDDVDLVQVLVTMLERRGVETVQARDGEQAIELTRYWHPNVMILDLGLPIHDGYHVVQWLRDNEPHRPSRLVIYTARDLSEDDQHRLRLGPTEFYTKSRITPDQFEACLVRILDELREKR